MDSLVTTKGEVPNYSRTLPLNREILIVGIPVPQSPTRRRSWWRFASLGIGLLALAILRWQSYHLNVQVGFLLEKMAIIGVVTPIVYTVGMWHLGRQR